MRIARWLMLLASAGAMYAQSWDTSGNSKLNGTYYFRQVYYVIGDDYGDLSEAVTIYGNISFDGNGNYSITTASNAAYIDYSYEDEGVVGGGVFTATGTYSIAASGYGFMTSPYSSGDYVYGLVSANGIFVGSSTDNSYGYNDMLIAAPVASPLPTLSSFNGSWTVADFDFTAGEPSSALGLVFNLSPDGAGNLNSGPITGYAGGSAQIYTQTSSGLKYTFSNGAAVATFPVNGELISGQKYFYFSKDGNFMFGGSPVTSDTPFDFIVAVKNTSATPTLSGLYYQAGFDNSVSYDEGYYIGDLDSYFGSFNVLAGAAPQTFLGHQRINDFAGSSVYDYTFQDTLSLSGSVYTSSTTRYIVGAGGAEMITAGIGPYLGISVGLQAAPVTPTSTVFIDPTRVQNSASNAPFTAGIAPGELLTFYGQNLADSTVVAGIPFPTTLGNVQVTIGGYQAPIYYVSSGQLSAIVPYEVTVGDIVDIQVTNDMGTSNVVSNYVANTAPGVFTQNETGLGYGAIEHLGIGNSVATPGSVVTNGDPAVEGETLAAYLTGLGAVSPVITDGNPGPSGTPSQTTNTIALDFNGTAGTNDFAGLAPNFSGLYQLNFTIPTAGITAGPNYFDISGPDSYMSYPLIPIQATATAAVIASDDKAPAAIPPRFRRPANLKPSLRNKQAKKPFSEVKTGK